MSVTAPDGGEYFFGCMIRMYVVQVWKCAVSRVSLSMVSLRKNQ